MYGVIIYYGLTDNIYSETFLSKIGAGLDFLVTIFAVSYFKIKLS